MIVARIGDTVSGIMMYPPPPAGPGPIPGVGIITGGDPNNLSGGLPVARIGDTVMFPIGPAFITTGTPNELSTAPPVARVGDSVIGPLVTGGIITMGNANDMSM